MKHIKRLTIAGLTAVMLFTGVPYVQMTDTASPAITTTKEVVHAAAKKLTKKQKKMYAKCLMECGLKEGWYALYDINGDKIKELVIQGADSYAGNWCKAIIYDIKGIRHEYDVYGVSFYNRGFDKECVLGQGHSSNMYSVIRKDFSELRIAWIYEFYEGEAETETYYVDEKEVSEKRYNELLEKYCKPIPSERIKRFGDI